MRADGTENLIKARTVLLGNKYRPSIDFGNNTYAPCAQIRTARMMVADAVQHRKCIKACDAKQAFTNGQAERRVFVQAPPGRVRDYDIKLASRMSTRSPRIVMDLLQLPVNGILSCTTP